MKTANLKGKTESVNTERRKLLKLLTYERRGKRPIYYRDYKRVLSGELPLEAVMGSGFLQAFVIEIILRFLMQRLDPKRYAIFTNEVGFKLPWGGWYNLDIAIWEREKIKQLFPQKGYIDMPPKVVIEVDTKVDLEDFEKRFGQSYINAKTEDLLKAGVERVIWVQTDPKKVLFATKGKQPWVVANWDYPFEVLEGVVLNLEGLLAQNL